MSTLSIALFVLAFLALLVSGPLWALTGAFIYYCGRLSKSPAPESLAKLLTRKPPEPKPEEPAAPRGRVLKP